MPSFSESLVKAIKGLLRMFIWSKEEELADKIVHLCKPLVDASEIQKIEKKIFWNDPFVLGFLGGIATVITDQLCDNGTKADKPTTIRHAFKTLSNTGGLVITKNFFTMAAKKESDFAKGVESASLFVYHSKDEINLMTSNANKYYRDLAKEDFADTFVDIIWFSEIRNRLLH